MGTLFIKVIEISIVASFLMLAVIIFRLPLKKAPKWFMGVLWAIVALRLLFPFQIESKIGFLPDVGSRIESFFYDVTAVDSGIEVTTHNYEPNTGDEVTYVYEADSTEVTESEEIVTDYLPNEEIITETSIPGAIVYADSSISVSAINYVIMKEEDYKAADHDNMSWNDYKLANNQPVALEVPEDMINVVSKATGIKAENVAMAAYTEYVYFDRSGSKVTVTDVLQILLILAILGLLAFIIIRSMWTSKKTEEEPEPEPLSVEQLLESQPEELLEDIEMDTGSETKRLIEKFVDENPEAAATLLRNWLNEDYA